MKHSLKRVMAMLIAIVFAFSCVALAEDIPEDSVVFDDEAMSENAEPDLPEIAFSLGEDMIGDDRQELPPSDDPAPEIPRVTFRVSPADAIVSVYPAPTEDIPDPAAIDAETDGSYLLLGGDYLYSIEEEGYCAIALIPFSVDTENLLIECALKPLTNQSEQSNTEDTLLEQIESDKDDAIMDEYTTIGENDSLSFDYEETSDIDKGFELYSFDEDKMDSSKPEIDEQDISTFEEYRNVSEPIADSDILFNGYVMRLFGLSQSTGKTYFSKGVGMNATGERLVLYETLRNGIIEVAAGQRSSTTFEIPVSEGIVYNDDLPFKTTRISGSELLSVQK